jgi:hypothetical protein
MKNKRLWAPISRMTTAFLVLVTLGLTVALPAGARTQTPVLWEYPGTHPYEGPAGEAARMHEAKMGFPANEYMRGVDMKNAGQCPEYFIQDGDLLWNTFTKNKFSKSIYTQAAMKYSNKDVKAEGLSETLIGTPLPTDHEKRRALKCDLGRADGAHVVYPFVCGNWSLGFFPVAPVTPPQIKTMIAKAIPVAQGVSPTKVHVEPFGNCQFLANKQVVEPGFTTYVGAVGGYKGSAGFAPAIWSTIPMSIDTNSRLICEQ